MKYTKNIYMSDRYLDSNGFYHRTDGPAIIWEDDVEEWYVKGDHIRYSEIKEWMICNNITKWPFNEEERILFELTFG